MSLPTPNKDVPMDRDRSKLAPGFNARVTLVLADLIAGGFDPIVVEAFRTDERQRFLYGFGRVYDDGRGIVTMAKDASKSMHGYGLAVDIVSKSLGWGATPKFWEALASAAERHGCAAGLRWKMKDSPHIQWASMPVGPTAYMVAERAAGRTKALWEKFGAEA